MIPYLFTSNTGLRRAVELLSPTGADTRKKILLISDGEENTSPYIADVIDEV